MYIGENTEYNWIFDKIKFRKIRISSKVSIQTKVIIERNHAGELWGGLIVDIRDNHSHIFKEMLQFEEGIDLTDQGEIDYAVASLRKKLRKHMLEYRNRCILN